MTIPILPWEETCSTAGKHYLCYRVRCNLAKKCYVDELKNKVQEKTATSNKTKVYLRYEIQRQSGSCSSDETKM